MNILVTGASGMIGSALVPRLQIRKHRLFLLVRRKPQADHEIRWDPTSENLDSAALGDLDAAVHLAGESIASGRWSASKKSRIVESRVAGTSLLSRTLAELQNPPKVMISASAIGYYGNRGTEWLREDSPRGSGFLADVCAQWEQAACPVAGAGVRLVLLRIGVVLDSSGGVLRRMLLPFSLGLGGRIGNGRQYMSWIDLEDLVEVILFTLENPICHGPINAVAPNPVSNRAYTRTLGRLLKRPTIFPVPAIAIRLLFGEMGEQLLLGGARIRPGRLLEAGFRFRYPELESSLRRALSR